MQTNEANIEIKKTNGIIESVSVIMPTWHKVEDGNSFTTVNIPLLGMKTFANTNNDSFVAINEAIKCFCIASEKFGQGIVKELQTIGWSIKEETDKCILMHYNIAPTDFVLEQIMETGDQFAKDNLILD